MNAASFLSAVVEIAIGIAGFAGIVAAIRQRRLSSWPPEQLVLLEILFAASAAAIVAGILPSFLTETGMSESNIWKCSSTALVFWLFGAIWFRVRQSKALGVSMQVPVHVRIWVLLSIALQTYNIATEGTAWPYLFGITTMLVNGFSVFLILILRPRENEENST